MKPGADLFGRVRAQFLELGGALTDVARVAGTRRVLDEQLQQADEQVRGLQQEIGTLKAQRFTTRERLDASVSRLSQREAQAVAALQAGRHDLAREVAESIVALEQERDAERALLTRNEARMTQLQAQLHRGENILRRLRHELDLVRAADAVSSAERVFCERAEGDAPGIPTAIDSAELLRSRQAAPARHPVDSTADRNEEDPLDEKLREAGLAEPASAVDVVLARIEAQASATAAKKPRARKRAARTPSDRPKDVP